MTKRGFQTTPTLLDPCSKPQAGAGSGLRTQGVVLLGYLGFGAEGFVLSPKL